MNSWTNLQFSGFKLVSGHWNDVDPANRFWVEPHYVGQLLGRRTDGGDFFVNGRISETEYKTATDLAGLLGAKMSIMLQQLMTYRDCTCTPTANCQFHPAKA